MTASIVERLRAEVPTSGHMAAMGSTSMLINPAGPEAAALIEKLERALEGMVEHYAPPCAPCYDDQIAAVKAYEAAREALSLTKGQGRGE